jgi:hypothetical protein
MWRLPALLLLAVMIVGAYSNTYAVSDLGERYLAQILPVSLPKDGGIATIQFRFWEDSAYCQRCEECCDEAESRYFQVEIPDKHTTSATVLRDDPWLIGLDADGSHEELISVKLTPNDTSMVYLRITYDDHPCNGALAWFVTRPDTTEFWYHPPGQTLADRLNRKPDTTLYRAWINLSDTVRRRVFLERFEEVEHKYGAPVPVGDTGIYHFLTPRGGVEHLLGERWKAGYIDTPPPMPDQPRGCSVKVETGPRRPPVKNPRRPDTSSKGNGEVWIDEVDGADEWCQLRANELITFRLWFCNNTGYRIGGLGMGFEVSEDPWGPYVDWDYTYIDTSGPLGWYNAFSDIAFMGRSLSGTGADSVKIMAIWDLYWGDYGIPAGFTEEALTITIGPIDPAYSGAAICVDSSWVGGASGGGVHQDWIWADSTGAQSFVPEWQGEECFYVVGPDDFPVTGFVHYWDPTPGNECLKPAQNIRVELWDDDGPLFDDEFLAEDVTGFDGFFDFGMITNDDGWFGGGLDLYLKAYPANPACSVTSSYGSECIASLSNVIVEDAVTQPYSFYFYQTDPDNGPFFVADAILDGCEKWSELAGYWPATPVEVILNPLDSTTGTEYVGGLSPRIYIDSYDDSSSQWRPGTFVRHSILHEYGHFLAERGGFFSGPGGYHRWDLIISPELAGVEGWSQFWSGLVDESPHRVRYNFTFTDSAYFNLETGYFRNFVTSAAVNACGDSNEISVAATLWDILDNWDDDYSDVSHWGNLALGPSPDGIGDSLDMPFSTLLDCLMREVTPGQQPLTLEDFWDAWFMTQPTHFGHNQAMADIWYEHGVDGKSCCISIRGNADGDVAEGANVADLTYLIE